MQTRLMTQRRSSFVAVACLTLCCTACSDPASDSVVLTADLPLHLEDHLDVATIEGSEVPADLPEPVEWRFDEPQPDWKATPPWNANPPARLTRTADGLLVTLTDAMRSRGGNPGGGIYIDVSDFEPADWEYVVVRARSENEVARMVVHFNLREGSGASTDQPYPYEDGEDAPVIRDGTVQTYRFQTDVIAWKQLGLWFDSREPGSIEVLSVSLVSKAGVYADAPHGMRSVLRGRQLRRALYTHAPSRVEYPVRVPEAGRLDVGLGVLRDDAPVEFAITATQQDGAVEMLLEETYADRAHWGQRSVDLSHLAGQTVTLALEAAAARAGTVAQWAAPTVSGAGGTETPNIIFYVMDGAGADYMSVYGYNRRTTPTLERLADEGAVFEHAYSNSDWTRPSTASFMTSLHHSVLGGFKNGFNVIPADAQTMAQHLHQAEYLTAVFTANPNAGRMSGLERGVDVFQEDWAEFDYGGQNYRESSRFLHEAFWDWREEYPVEPYWVHFQTTDTHEESHPAVAPFSGLFVSPEQVKTWTEWNDRLRDAGGRGEYSENFEKTGISRVEFNTLLHGMFDERMAHNDYQLGRLVERLKAEGQWENTLLIVGSDHGQGTMHDTGIAMLDSLPPRWGRPMFRTSISRVPLIVVWPGRIPGGQRIDEAVSMIDVLPTILDLVGLPMPEVMQGQSLAPLLLDGEGWEPRPVILDMFNADGIANEVTFIEVVDGRWGASLEISPLPQPPPGSRRPVPLLLYDLWNDPMCLYSLHEERPDLVKKYTEFLEAQWEAHQLLAQQFTPGEESPLTPEQLRTLRSLGYIR